MGSRAASSRAAILIIWWWCLIQYPKMALGSKTKHFKWEVEYMYWSPDCVEHVVMGINGHFPGPTIRAQAGDTIHVELTNKLPTEGVVIHWHGIRQHGTPWADGTASISQCVINPGETFLYRFKVDKAGTYFYHGHYGMQRSAGLYGSLVVDVAEGEKEPFHYDGEFNLLLSDWWHQSVHEQELGLSSKPFRWPGEPQFEYKPSDGENHQTCCVKGGVENLRKVTFSNITKNEETQLIVLLCYDDADAVALQPAEIGTVVHRRDEFFWEQLKLYSKRDELGD